MSRFKIQIKESRLFEGILFKETTFVKIQFSPWKNLLIWTIMELNCPLSVTSFQKEVIQEQPHHLRVFFFKMINNWFRSYSCRNLEIVINILLQHSFLFKWETLSNSLLKIQSSSRRKTRFLISNKKRTIISKQ